MRRAGPTIGNWIAVTAHYKCVLWIKRIRVPIGLEALGRSAYFK